jgi:hypothetical protein
MYQAIERKVKIAIYARFSGRLRGREIAGFSGTKRFLPKF